MLSSAFLALAAICAWRVLMRFTVNRSYVSGMREVQKKQFAEAAEAFRQSIAFWERHPTLDRLRSAALLSPTRYSYLEMGRYHLACCLLLQGQKDEAVEIYRQLQARNPNNEPVAAALSLIEEMTAPKDTPEGEPHDA